MNNHLLRVYNNIKEAVRQFYLFHKELSLGKKLSVFSVYIILITGFLFLTKSKITPEVSTLYKRQVTLESVATLSDKSSNFPFLGTVTSVSEATIRAESSGKLTRVYKSLGDKVNAGDIIAEFENSSESAAVQQAEGVYESARAGKDIASLSGQNSNTSLTETKNGALNALGLVYNALDDAVRVKTDSAFSDPKTVNVKFNLAVPDSHLIYSIEDQRKTIENVLTMRDTTNRTLTSDSALLSELTKEEKEATQIKNYLDDLALAYAKALPSNLFSQGVLDANKSQVSAARNAVASAISTIQSSRSALNNSLTAKDIAEKNSSNTSSATTANGNVKQALGAYNAALSRYEKTIIRSPLSGTLNSLSIKTGEFLVAFAQVGVVSNNGTLEIKAYVSQDDANRITIGTPALLKKENTVAKGIVTKVAEAIDPLTKKIEVKIALTDKTSKFINGESVTINLESVAQKIESTASPLRVPLSALKMTPDGAFIFTAQGNIVHAHKVTEGAIFGEDIEIKEGITRDSKIVTDARGLKEGMEVILK